MYNKMAKYIFTFITISLSIFIYIMISRFLPKIICSFYIILVNILILLYIYALYYLIYKTNKDNKELNENLSNLNNISNELLNIFYIYFDNSFLIINTIVQEEKDINTKISDFNELYKKFKEHSRDKIKTDINKEKNKNELSIKTDLLINEIKIFLNLINSIEDLIFNNFKERILDIIKKEEFKQMVIEYEYYSEIIFEFINSIINNINQTSKPLSEQILIIKQNINMFIKQMINWKDELLNEGSKKNFNNIIKKYNIQNYEFKNTADIISTGYTNMEKNLKNLVNMIEKIYDDSFKIQDISEKIKILSVNASIESSRAGAEHYGFKIISYEIKKLSETTHNFIANILSMISDAKDIAKDAIEDFNDEVHSITLNLKFQKEGFEEFYNTLNNYYMDFNSIFSSISGLTNAISLHIDKFNPIFQLHDISIQELGNVNIINRKFIEDNKNEILKIINTINDDRKKLILNNILNVIETKITTDSEIEVMNMISEKYDLKREITLYKKESIEIF